MLYFIIIGISALIRRPKAVYYKYVGLGLVLWLIGDTLVGHTIPLMKIGGTGPAYSGADPLHVVMAVGGLLLFRITPFGLAWYGYRKSQEQVLAAKASDSAAKP